MKRLTVITALFSVSLLAGWAFFEAHAASSAETQSANVPMKVYNETGEMPKDHQSEVSAIPVTGMDMKIAPVFDATGAIVSDPTGTILSVIHSGDMAVLVMDMKIAPVFDVTGAVVSDPTGTLLSVIHSGHLAVPLQGRDMKIAPVFDTTGALVSDPTGTILSVIHSGNMAVPVTGADVKIAPVFDTTGRIVSDPTGTLLSVINP